MRESLSMDAMEPVKRYLELGGTIRQLASISQMNQSAIMHWINNGVPSAVVNWDKPPFPTQVQAYRTLLRSASVLMKNIAK